MNSIKCPQCGMVNWATAGACKRCGVLFAGVEASSQAEPGHWKEEEAAADQGSHMQSGYNAPGYSTQGQQGYQQSYQQGYQQGYQQSAPYSYNCAPAGPKSSGLAIASMILGILGMVTFGLFGFLGLLGLIFGIIALSKAKNYPARYGGQGFAIAGIVTSSLSMVVFVLVLSAIAIPNLLASRKAANEGSALSSLRALNSSEAAYQATAGQGNYGTIDELHNQGLIDAKLASGIKSGYRFVIRTNPSAVSHPATFEVVATPVEYGTSGSGNRSFFVDESGVIRAANKHGMEAAADDPPLDESSSQSEYRDARRTDY